MTAKPYDVSVIQARGERDWADCQAALAYVPARMPLLHPLYDTGGVWDIAEGAIVIRRSAVGDWKLETFGDRVVTAVRQAVASG